MINQHFIDIILCYLGGDDHAVILIRIGAWKSASVKVMSGIERGCRSTKCTVFKLLKFLLRVEDDVPPPAKPPNIVSIRPRTDLSRSCSRVWLRDHCLCRLSLQGGRSGLLREAFLLGGLLPGLLLPLRTFEESPPDEPFYLIFYSGAVLRVMAVILMKSIGPAFVGLVSASFEP